MAEPAPLFRFQIGNRKVSGNELATMIEIEQYPNLIRIEAPDGAVTTARLIRGVYRISKLKSPGASAMLVAPGALAKIRTAITPHAKKLIAFIGGTKITRKNVSSGKKRQTRRQRH